MTEKFNAKIFEEWQNLINAWDGVEGELKGLEAAKSSADIDRDSKREADLRAELGRLKAQIDAVVLLMSENRDHTTEEMVVALIDTKPERKSLAQMVRERLPRSAKRH